MGRKEKSVIDTDLHAYIDGELDEAGRLRVEAYLAIYPEESKHIRKCQKINSGLHYLFDPVLNEPVPEIFRFSKNKIRYPSIFPKMLRVAAVVSFMAITGIAGWMAHDQWGGVNDARELVHLVRPAAFAHYVYSTDPHYPVEFSASKKEVLADWLSDRMHTDIKAPILSNLGFNLIGGRLLPSTNRMAAQFMYQNSDKERITVYVRRDDWNSQATEFQYRNQDGVQIFYWSDGVMGYAVTGSIHKTQLIEVAHQVHKAFSGI